MYRGSGENALQLYKLLDGGSKGFNDTDLEINTNYVYGLQGVFKDGSLTEIKKITTKY